MVGIRVEYPTFVYCGNCSVVMEANLLDSTLKKKINSITYYFSVRGVQRIIEGVEGLVQMITLQT